MKIRYLLIGMLSSALAGNAQKADTLFQKKPVAKSDIQLLFSYYSQDGDHSAVTGGIGTEKLQVYASSLSLNHIRGNSTISFDGGADVITSASTDNIDFVMSSASLKDARIYAHAGFSQYLPKSRLELGARTGFSIESDYLSIPILFHASYKERSLQRYYSFGLELYFDDLRWGRLDPEYHKPVELIYPVELRYKEWYDDYRRNTYTFQSGVSQVINKRVVTGLYGEFIYQSGLLATPFHRVYFNNDSLRVENLPDERIKIPAGIKLNFFVGSRTILKGNYNFYWDSWGVLANAFEVESAIKINPRITLSPFVRIYTQSASKYFKPYKEHSTTEIFYSSDYDLSEFTSYKVGLGFEYSPSAYAGKIFLFRDIGIRYSAYFRNDKLHAQNVTLITDMSFQKIKKE